jgi:hypothetical protein
MALLTTVVAFLVSKVFFIESALGTGCSSSLLLLSKCCALGCHRRITLDDQRLKIIHQCQCHMAAAGECLSISISMIICHGLLKLTVLLVVAIDK